MRVKPFDLMARTLALVESRGLSFTEARRELGKQGAAAKAAKKQRRSKSFQARIEREERQGLR